MALFPRNDVMLLGNPDNHNVSKSDNVKKYKTKFRKNDNNYWPPVTLPIAGDSIVRDIDKKRLSMNNRNWDRIRDICQIIRPIIKKKSEFLEQTMLPSAFNDDCS